MRFNFNIFFDLLIVTALVIAVHSYDSYGESYKASIEGPPGRMHIANRKIHCVFNR